MKIIVIGLGSMGKRRIRLLKQINDSFEIIGIDSRLDRRQEAAELYGLESYPDLDSVLDTGVDCAIVATSPLSHGKIISRCLQHGIHTFTEINLVPELYEENVKLAQNMDTVLFLSSTFLYRAEIEYIQAAAKNSKSLLTYSYHVGQYLPDWHPWESYTDYFIGDNRTNGCREIMAIDFPWLYKTFGKFVDIQIKKGKKTGLKTTYADSYILLVEHESGVQGSLLIDVVSRKAVRNFELFGEDLYICWDGTADGLKQYDCSSGQEIKIALYDRVDKQSEYAAFIVENAYKKELLCFLAEIKSKETAVYGFEDDKYILDIIDKIEKV